MEQTNSQSTSTEETNLLNDNLKLTHIRYYKFKQGTPLQIIERFGNGDIDKVIGYYLENNSAKERIVLTDTFPPLKLNGKIINKRYCHYSLIKDIEYIMILDKGSYNKLCNKSK